VKFVGVTMTFRIPQDRAVAAGQKSAETKQ
jgi:hypothetical protein